MFEIAATLIFTHITIICVTLYLHRSLAHGSVTFHPALNHFMRFWLWLTTGMVTKEWVAIHRKHHRFTDKAGDPHSPHIWGILWVLFDGATLYKNAAKFRSDISFFGEGTPDDWIERNIYSTQSALGISLMLIIDLIFFGWWGAIMWGIQMLWIPILAAGVINGLGHWWGYSNFKDIEDKSRNIFPIGILIGGEELHAGHHHKPGSPKLSERWFEFDIGWLYIQIFRYLGLAKLRMD